LAKKSSISQVRLWTLDLSLAELTAAGLNIAPSPSAYGRGNLPLDEHRLERADLSQW
jgi:hypothetical protein